MLEDIPPVKTAAEVLRKEEENRRVIALRKKKIRRLTFERVLTPNAAVDRPPVPPPHTHRELIIHGSYHPSLCRPFSPSATSSPDSIILMTRPQFPCTLTHQCEHLPSQLNAIFTCDNPAHIAWLTPLNKFQKPSRSPNTLPEWIPSHFFKRPFDVSLLSSPTPPPPPFLTAANLASVLLRK